ncbi:unnamed protein product [Coregonus sp. 'balchen']|nr:unnamed protein product [Coregonus sp. 'balchen']
MSESGCDMFLARRVLGLFILLCVAELHNNTTATNSLITQPENLNNPSDQPDGQEGGRKRLREERYNKRDGEMKLLESVNIRLVLQFFIPMDLGNIRDLMRKTQASIVENQFLGKRIDELKDAVGSDGVRITMESALTARDRTYIGSVLVSVNPYKDLEIYTKNHMERYRGVNFYEDQCILISGESGAGKTEASKKILQYYAVTCPASDQVETVKDRLLQSNPVLEAFGNAKTLRNDNSSRFGKYMDIQFDFKGAPVGGHILNYLLEKSRVVHQNHGERNFHIFYQLIEGGEEDLLRRLGLEKNPQQYQYLVKGNCPKVSSINDRSDWKVVRKALSVIGFNEDEVEELLNIIASVLHLGNIQYGGEDSGNAYITTDTQIKYLARLLGVDGLVLKEALTHKKIIAKGEELKSPLNLEQAASARDALSKAVYGRTFTWLVNKINVSLAYKFCINYCNEKLQQLFIELTLKSEQDEYEAEGITWEPVQYFNNKIICDLVEEKFKGIISILDEECLRPGDASDITFLEKLENTVGGHAHLTTCFLDKNNDLLFRNLKEVMCMSENKILTQCFDRAELKDSKRPETAATQFKTSLAKLMEILMSKEPSHQVKYLGLMENLRVRRAGFAYRRHYETFLQRYKSLCPETWPSWQGKLADGVSTLVKHLGYKPEEYKLGRSKIFIRFPKTLFATEDALETRKHSLASKLQSSWKGYRQKTKYRKLRSSAVVVQAWWRGILACRRAQRRRQAANTIRSCAGTSPKQLRKLYMQNMVWGYCKRINPEWKHQLEQKMVASISVSSLSDGVFVLHVPTEDKKQKSDHIIETLTKVAICADKVNSININQGSITFTVGQGKEGIIDFTSGSELLVAKAKNGHLSVVSRNNGRM